MEIVQWGNMLVRLAYYLNGGQVDISKSAKDGFGFGCCGLAFWVTGVYSGDFLPGFCQIFSNNVFEQGQRTQADAQKPDQASSPIVIL